MEISHDVGTSTSTRHYQQIMPGVRDNVRNQKLKRYMIIAKRESNEHFSYIYENETATKNLNIESE